uniref:FCP1 homology domain-containing protein n=1 Tax=Davidia involucrata TaxID=16924 RepID=A0A5B6ZQF9_DAVIN
MAREEKEKQSEEKADALKGYDRHDDDPEGTSSMKNSGLERESFAQPPVNTCLRADLDIKRYDAEASLSQDMNEVKEQKKRYNASESNTTSHNLQEGDGRLCSDLTNVKYFEEVHVNPVSAVAEHVGNFPESEDTSSTKKHDDHAEVDIISLGAMCIKTYKRKKQVEICHSKRRKASKEGIGPSVLVVQNKMGDTSLDCSDEALASVNSVNMVESEVAEGHGTSLQAVEEISIEKASGGCSVGEPVSEESKKRVEMETLKQTIIEDGFVKNDSVVDFEENFEHANRGKINIIQDAVQDVYSAEEILNGSSSFKEDKALVGASGSDLFHEHLDKNTLEMQSKMEDAISSSSKLGAIKDDASLVINKEEQRSLQVVQSSPERAVIGCFRKKLLILDVNGLLVDIVPYVSDGYQADTVVARKAVFKRPFCDDFLQFCFERFNVGVWSSRTKRNLESVLDFLMGKTKHNFLFCWNQSHCTKTGYNTVENNNKPLLLKELKKLWEKHEPNLLWERGEYNESNTLLLDDSPYKALSNPPNTAIFPYTYEYKDVNDNSLGPGGDLRVYLEGLALAENVQKYVEQNPYGQRPITEKNLSWAFYIKVIDCLTSIKRCC